MPKPLSLDLRQRFQQCLEDGLQTTGYGTLSNLAYCRLSRLYPVPPIKSAPKTWPRRSFKLP
jgi:hypothetical protein